MIRKLHDEDAELLAVSPRTLKQRLAETDEMIRQAERQCVEEPNSFANKLELDSLRRRRESILEKLNRLRSEDANPRP